MPSRNTPRIRLFSGTFIKNARSNPGNSSASTTTHRRQEQDHPQQIAARFGHLCSSRRQPDAGLQDAAAGDKDPALTNRIRSSCKTVLLARTPPPENILRPPDQVGHEAARFPHQDDAGGDVPGIEAVLPIAVIAAGRDVGQIQRGRAEPPHPGS